MLIEVANISRVTGLLRAILL